MKSTSQPVPSEYTLITWINLCKCKNFEWKRKKKQTTFLRQLLYLFFAMEIAAKLFKLFYVPVKFEENLMRKYILCVALFLIEVEKNVKMYSFKFFFLCFRWPLQTTTAIARSVLLQN